MTVICLMGRMDLGRPEGVLSIWSSTTCDGGGWQMENLLFPGTVATLYKYRQRIKFYVCENYDKV
jgi:hypothetical protein